MTNLATRYITAVLETVSCSACGTFFAVEATVRQMWQRDGKTFYCPNGHSQVYRESDVQRLQKQLKAEQDALAKQKAATEFAQKNAAAERAAREATERQLTARKAANTRLRNRVKNGVCPCCHRTVSQLAQHMKTKHP